MTPHRRTDGDGHEIHERVTDRDIWARMSVTADRYKLVWGFWLIVFSAFGWVTKSYLEPLRAVTPLQAQTVRIEKKIDSLVIPRLDQADQDRKDIAQVLKVFGKILCAQTSAADRYKYDINCRTDIPAPDPKPTGEF